MRSATKTKIRQADTGVVCQPFFSIAMREWRIEFLGFLISDYRQQRQSSIYCESHEDAVAVYAIVRDITTWDAWVASADAIRAAMLDGSGGRVWRTGIPGVLSENFQRQTA